MMSRTGAEIVTDILKKVGVRHVFGIVSIHNMPIVDAICRADGIEMVTARNEQSATHMADGYARATGGLGVSLASTGPGTTNTVTGLYESAYASSRVLVVTGQAETTFYGKGKGYVHEAENQKPMLESVARSVASPKYISELETQLVSVIEDIFSARPQPGAIEIPIDLQYASSEALPLEISLPAPVEADAELIKKAVTEIKNTRRRVILAGGGIGLSGASETLREFAEKLDAPVLTTLNGKGALRDDHPLLLGPVLMSGPVLKVLSEADLLIAVGTRFQAFQAGVAGNQISGPLPKLIHIDIDPRNINLNYKAEVGVVGDARGTLQSLTLGTSEAGDAQFREKIKTAAAQTKSANRERIGPDHAILLDSITRYMDRDAFFVRDNTIPGYYWGNGLLPVFRPGGYIVPTSGAIGPGLPLGMGVAVATGTKTIIMHGDGGFMYHVGELATAAQYQMPIVVLVFNDGGFGVLRALQANQFDGRINETELNTPDFVMLCESMGVKGLTVDDPAAFDSCLAQAMGHSGPVLININVRNMIPLQGIVPAPADNGLGR
ncbi:MAG: thiamine pyrophosphate-binding protein [Pseudomonadales bacterium]|nr:thiamine pyrophosphate-binding protein [Pseudomonadales bacterium]